jgi:hypothetical protein
MAAAAVEMNSGAAAGDPSKEAGEPPPPRVVEHEEDPVQDAVIERVGKWGRWQLSVFLLLSIKGILGAWQVISPTFTAPDLDHWCARPPDDVFANWTAEQWKEFAIPRVNVTKVCSRVQYHRLQMRI